MCIRDSFQGAEFPLISGIPLGFHFHLGLYLSWTPDKATPFIGTHDEVAYDQFVLSANKGYRGKLFSKSIISFEYSDN